MSSLDLPYILRMVSDFSGIPIRCFAEDAPAGAWFPVRLPRDPMEVCRKEIFSICGPAGYYVSPLFHYYGVVNGPDIRIVLGPTSQIPAAEQDLRELAFRAGVPPEEVPAFLSGMRAIARLPVESLLQLLCLLDHLVNGGEKPELTDIAIFEKEQRALKEGLEKHRTRRVYEAEPPQSGRAGALAAEKELTEIIRRGDTPALKSWLSHPPAVRGGTIAQSELRQLRNTFVVTATLASRAAIRGGMREEDALALSDGYIQRAELLSGPGGLMNLQVQMLLEYTEQVEKLQLGGHPTPLAAQVAGYVRQHLSEPVRVETMAEVFYMSRPYLSARFRKETGMTLTDYILREKTEEAKRLLRYSDRSVAAVGAYLGFSSTAHFSRVFRKYAQATPREYRDMLS